MSGSDQTPLTEPPLSIFGIIVSPHSLKVAYIWKGVCPEPMNDRRAGRVTLRCPILIEGDDYFADGRLIDISTPGCGIETNHPLQSGEYVQLRMMTSVGIPSLTVPLSKVRWVDQGRCGVELLLVQDAVQMRLKEVLREIEPLEPGLHEFLRRRDFLHPRPIW